jgi:uncharacterized protein YbjT (DUF2867 family)
MRIAVAGATGLTGRAVVHAVESMGGEAIPLARRVGVDLLSGAGVTEAMRGVEALIDVTNAPTADELETMTQTLMGAARRAGARHVVLLSIIAAPRLPERPHYMGKLAQERAVIASGLPYTIVRAAQYFEFGEMMAAWRQQGDVAVLEDALLQPVDVGDVGEALARAAMAAPANGVIEIAGPEQIGLVELARRTLAARGAAVRVEVGGSEDATSDTLRRAFLPSPGALTGRHRFADWLDRLQLSS